MSIKIMSHIWEHAEQAGTALLMLLALADNANEDGICWPGISYLARKTRMSERQAQRLIKKLAAEKAIIIRPRYRNTHLYQFPGWKGGRFYPSSQGDMDVTASPDQPSLIQPLTTKSGGEGDTDVTLEKANGDVDVTLEATNGVGRVTPVSPKGDTAMSPEPSLTVNTNVSTTVDLWPQVLEELQLQLTTSTYTTYLQRTRALPDKSNRKLVVEVHNAAAVDWLSHRMLVKAQGIAERLAGRPIPIQFVAKEAARG